jgi:hypothetical protein
MPNKILIDVIKSKLPPFVTLYEETYKGARYKAKFRDIEYDQDFESTVINVIKNQTGCPKRRNSIISQQSKGTRRRKIPLSEVLGKIPPNLKIDPSTYSGVRNKSTFTDLTTGEVFRSIVWNIIRGTGVSPTQAQKNTNNKNTLSVSEIQERIKQIYKGRVVLVEETYTNTQTPCLWLVNGSPLKLSYNAMSSGRYFSQRFISRWSSYVGVRDNFTCQKCRSTNKICCHHIISFKNEEQRYNIHNGICLCASCHSLYHSKYKSNENLESLICFLENEKLAETLRERLSLPALLPVFGA